MDLLLVLLILLVVAIVVTTLLYTYDSRFEFVTSTWGDIRAWFKQWEEPDLCYLWGGPTHCYCTDTSYSLSGEPIRNTVTGSNPTTNSSRWKTHGSQT